MEDGKTKSINFRRMLLTKCQQEFEKDKKDDETLEAMREECEKAETVRCGHGGSCDWPPIGPDGVWVASRLPPLAD